jgi:polyisoprenyl-phosphate glycosyltransferase
MGSRFNAACNHFFFGQPSDLKVNSYYACQRFVVDAALQYPNPFPYVTGLLFQSVSRYCNVPVQHRARLEGKSGYTLKKLISLWTNGVTAFSIKPLRFANYLGWLTAVFGFVFAIVTVLHKLFNPNIEAGWSSTIAVLLVLGGLIIALIGVVGEYIGRIYLSINRCPQYVVRNVIDRRLAPRCAPSAQPSPVGQRPGNGEDETR